MKTATLPKPTRQDPQVASRSRLVIPKAHGLKIKKVLVAIDFSEPSLQAFEFALPILKHFGAQLHLVHVSAPAYPLTSRATMPLVVSEVTVGKRVRRHLRDVAKKYSVKLEPGTVHALRGRAFTEICRLARAKGIDLIITSTRGLTGLKHLALGSTAERVVRYSPCPVLVVRPSERKSTAGRNGLKTKRDLSFHKILVPTDFSECAMKGVAYAKALAGEFGSKLVLLHSVAPQYYVTNDEYARYDFSLLMQQCENAARGQLGELVEKTDWGGVLELETSLQTGHPGDQICSRAADHRVDLIVVSTHGRTGLKHIFIGSTAEYVMRHAPCPVLVVPSHERPLLNSKKQN
jgi:nucleotide-binding universal stress UspA family protein